jgi:predicted transcriptional regulator
MNAKSQQQSPPSPQITLRLGAREREVLEVLWVNGGATVQGVAGQLKAPLAYTTVMTTLERLYRKRLLVREKRERAFFYRPAVSQSELERGRAGALVRGFFSQSPISREALLSYLLDAVHSYDSQLLHRLEEQVRAAKQQSTGPEGGAR